MGSPSTCIWLVVVIFIMGLIVGGVEGCGCSAATRSVMGEDGVLREVEEGEGGIANAKLLSHKDKKANQLTAKMVKIPAGSFRLVQLRFLNIISLFFSFFLVVYVLYFIIIICPFLFKFTALGSFIFLLFYFVLVNNLNRMGTDDGKGYPTDGEVCQIKN